ncbi:MAG TPA: helix-turn-helix transcriptional regulator [Beijerinckiaceae bacterium]|jgi:DNA-binding CsgD family transcriptional regulator
MISYCSNLQPRLSPFAVSDRPSRPLARVAGPGSGEAAPGLFTALTEALDWLEQGVVLVDAAGNVAFANAAARELLARGSGLAIAGGTLQARSPSDAAALRRLIAGCASGSSGGRSTEPTQPCRIGDPPLLILPVPSTRSAGSDGGAGIGILFIVDPGRAGLPGADDLQQFFGLTAAEAAVAAEILSGDGLRATSRRLGILPSTARSHLDRIFRKTGTRRQAELVRLLLSARHPVRRPSNGASGVGSGREA